MSHEVETMMSARGIKPWHFAETSKTGATTVVEGAPSAAEAIRFAQLDWDVELRKVYGESSKGNPKVIPGKHAVTRTTDDKVFSVVGGQYHPLQNRDAFTFVDNLLDDGLEYETAGALRGGSIVFLTAKIPETIMVGGEDAHELYIFLRNGHNGYDSVRVGITPVRIVCQNTMNMALGRQKRSWAISHLSTMEGKLSEAREALDLTFAYVDAWKTQAEELIGTKLSDEDINAFLDKVTEEMTETAQTKAVAGMRRLLDGKRPDDTPQDVLTCKPYANTAWGAFNAVGEYFEWYKIREQSGEARVIGNLVGQPMKMRDRALALLT